MATKYMWQMTPKPHTEHCLAQVAHHLETATSVWSAADLAAALPAAEPAAEDAGSENVPPATEPQTARCLPIPCTSSHTPFVSANLPLPASVHARSPR